jgi:hypothetical protein
LQKISMNPKSSEQNISDSMNNSIDSLPKVNKSSSQKLIEGITATAATLVVISAGVLYFNNPRVAFTKPEAGTIQEVLPKTAQEELNEAKQRRESAIVDAEQVKQKSVQNGKHVVHPTEHDPVFAKVNKEYKKAVDDANAEFSSAVEVIGTDYMVKIVPDFRDNGAGEVMLKFKKQY